PGDSSTISPSKSLPYFLPGSYTDTMSAARPRPHSPSARTNPITARFITHPLPLACAPCSSVSVGPASRAGPEHQETACGRRDSGAARLAAPTHSLLGRLIGGFQIRLVFEQFGEARLPRIAAEVGVLLLQRHQQHTGVGDALGV